MFAVTKKFGRQENRIKDFPKEAEAIEFIMDKLREDIRFKIMASYCLYEGADLLREYTHADVAVETPAATEESGGSAGKGSGRSFAPTPFATTPRVGPQSWIREDDDKKNEEDK